MSYPPGPFAVDAPPIDRLEVLFDELSELTGQRNAIDGRIVEIVAEMDHDELIGNTGCRSIAGLVAWRTGMSPSNAATIATVAHRLEEFPLCAAGMREGRLSVDQVGVIAERAADGSDAHYVELAAKATVSQLRKAVKLEPRPDPDPRPERQPSISKTENEKTTTYRITLPRLDAAKFDAALKSHHESQIAAWKRDRADRDGHDDHDDLDGRYETGIGASALGRPMPTTIDAFMGLVEAGWDAEAARRPHSQHNTVVMHFDVKDKIASLHLGPMLSDADRQYFTCDATCEAWFERDGQPIGAGRTTRQISRRLRRALEHRHPHCAVPGCGSTRGLHAHHIRHWEDGGVTELHNLVLLCPYHHRLHHRGIITITGPAENLKVTDEDGDELAPGSSARPPTTPPPDVPPCTGPLGERLEWWWYDPFEPQPPPSDN